MPSAQSVFRVVLVVLFSNGVRPAAGDRVRELQTKAIAEKRADWGHWGYRPETYAGWTRHTNRLIPIYTFGLSLDPVAGGNSVYRDPARLRELYGRLPEATHNPAAEYFDQTGVYELQRSAVAAGKKYIVLLIFDGMDWQTTQAAAIHASGRAGYREGRGAGLAFQDYRGVATDFGFFVTSPHNDGTEFDVDAQIVKTPGGKLRGGYDAKLGGPTPWTPGGDPAYLAGKSESRKQAVTDSAASATSMNSGIKTYNDAINVDAEGRQVVPLARQLQIRGMAVGVVTSVPISHATPACAYANNVSRDDFHDLTRDLVGLASIAHRDEPLPGVDVLLGCGAAEETAAYTAMHPGLVEQGSNYVPGNRYITAADLKRIDAVQGGKYQVARRAAGVNGAKLLAAASREAVEKGRRLFGFFGVSSGHLPFQTADGGYDPAPGVAGTAETYSLAEIEENPTLADMTRAALTVLETDPDGFRLMVEAGDVDWANHDDNLDNSIGAVLSGEAAFRAIVEWVEARDGWDETAVIVTADHGHYLVLQRPETLVEEEK
ncbi:MAG TPA: alkaline phosphatase [Pirellulales bacterium]|nr:alkaline phosphatase [Pirellulales bacterium]